MTDKQYAFIVTLENRVYGDNGREYYSHQLLKAINAKSEKISTRLASKVIDYLKSQDQLNEHSWASFKHWGSAANYFAMHGGLDDSEEEELIEEINAL